MDKKVTSLSKLIYRDIILVIIVTLITFLIARYLNLTEQFYAWSRHWEEYQADELLFPLFSLAISLIWFVSSRYQQIKLEDVSRQVLLSENRRLVQNLTKTQEQEKVALARELHDVFAQHLTALRTNTEIVQTLINSDDQTITRALDNIVSNTQHLHRITRSLLKTLRPPLLEFGIKVSVEELVTEWQHSHPVTLCELIFHGNEITLEDELILTIYRTIQEGLSNIARHAKANKVTIDLFFPDHNISEAPLLNLVITDNGAGFSHHNTQEGLGLIGLRERANSLNGTFTIISNDESSGSTLKLSLPLQ